MKVNTSIHASTELYLNKQYWYNDTEIVFIITDLDDKIQIKERPVDIGSGRYTFRIGDSKLDGKRIKIEVYTKAGYA